MARVDFLIYQGKVLLSEINTMPGLGPISLYPLLWEAQGLPFATLVQRLLADAIGSQVKSLRSQHNT